MIFTFGRKNKVFKSVYREINENATGEIIEPMKDERFSPALFETNELETMKTILRQFKDTTSRQLVEMSHEEKAWKESYKKSKYIDYRYSFELIHI